jgi:hypothetical protein
MLKKIFFFIFCIFFLQNVMGQYFSRTYFKESRLSRNFSVLPFKNNEVIISNGIVPDSLSYEVSNISKIKIDGSLIELKNFFSKRLFVNYSILTRNDTLFYCAKDSRTIDSSFYWYYGMIDTMGNKIKECKYKIPTPFDAFTNVYDLEFLKNDEVILWGNGFDPSIDNKREDLSMIWIRLKLDGTLISGPHYFKPMYKVWLIATDATTDIDGNMVLVYSVTDQLTGLWKEIYKINDDDSIIKIAKIDTEVHEKDHARLAVDKEGNFIIHDFGRSTHSAPSIIKVNRSGNTVWKKTFDIIYSDLYPWINKPNVSNFEVNSIKITANNDILICGLNTIYDSIYFPNLDKKLLIAGYIGSFIARYDQNGGLKWRHLLLSVKPNGSTRAIRINDISELPDGDIVVTGNLERKDTLGSQPNDVWVMKIGPNGCFDSKCSHIVDNRWWMFPDEIPLPPMDTVRNETLLIYPNPALDILKILLPDDVCFPITYYFQSLNGQTIEVGMQQDSFFSVDISGFPSAVYLFVCRDKSGKLWIKKWVKI